MTDHDPRAADVLADHLRTDGDVWCDSCKGPVLPDASDARDAASYALDALTAAGLAVRPADEYEQVGWHWSDDCCNRPVLDNAFRRAEVADLLAERDRLAAALEAIEHLHLVDDLTGCCTTCYPEDGGRPCCTLREVRDALNPGGAGDD